MSIKTVSNQELNLSFHVTTDSVEEVENNTVEYITKCRQAFEHIYGKSVIDLTTYSAFIFELPSDLACRLRLVPDSKLASRLSHLHQIISDITSGSPIAGTSRYSVVSIEGSNRLLAFDCDLVILLDDTQELVFVDYTSSKSPKVRQEKLDIIEANISTSNLKNSKAALADVIDISIKVDIDAMFVSNEPGTRGLKIMDYLAKMGESTMVKIIDRCASVYATTNLALADKKVEDAPGDYKKHDVPSNLVEDAIRLIQTQNDKDSLLLLNKLQEVNSDWYPYYDSLARICFQSQKLKKLVPIEASAILTNRDVESNLASLSSNWLCKALHSAMFTESVVAIDDANDVTFLSDFPCAKGDKYLPSAIRYKACIKHKSGHIFTIKFNPLHVDEKMGRVLTGSQPKKEKTYSKLSGLNKRENMERLISDSIADYNQDFNHFTGLSLDQPKDTVWKKIKTISALASNDLNNMGRSTTALLDNFIDYMEKLHLGSCLSHHYEINKTILASLKVSPGDSDYYVGINGSYKSITIVKMCSTLDSFKKTNYCVIYEPEREFIDRTTRLDQAVADGVAMTKFYSIDPNQLSYNLRLPFIITSFSTWEIENNLEGGSIKSGMIAHILFDCTMHSLVNRDQFAQVSEQVRYFYMSAIGYGGSASDIAEKVEFIYTRHSWEILFILRSFKIAACLNSISTMKKLIEIEDDATRELSVAFPHSKFPSKSFSQTVSSMYVCNIYNKFRAFHEVSDAICYNGIIEENMIYRTRVDQDPTSVSGLSPYMYTLANEPDHRIVDYMMSPDFVTKEVEFNLLLATLKPTRYSGSMTYIIGATEFHATTPDSVIDNIYYKLNMAPIEACTMRGSMDTGPSKAENQGIRAASAVLEEMIRQHGVDPKSVNKSVLGAANLFDKMQLMNKTFSIFMSVMIQFCFLIESYRYRMVDKDQKGHREISVLNYNFRIGALFVETISRELSSTVSDTEVVHNPNKDKIVEDAITASFETDGSVATTCFYDNSDQKRWGPNHNMNFFSYMLFVMLKKDPGLFRMVVTVMDHVFDKRAKFPEPLINLILTKGVRSSGSKPIQEFIDKAAPLMDNKIFEMLMAFGMCQGILHDTSSVYHAIKAKASINLAQMVAPEIKAKYFTTSDDAEGIVEIPLKSDRIQMVKTVHCTGLRVGNLFNIMRSNPKSAFNFHIAELNSIFYKKGAMATPTLKQRISKIDVGYGVNHVEDFLSTMASAANYMANGGSYMGTYIMTILNFVLHTEQWLRWDYVKSDSYYKPVEMGGFPVIEPLSTIISGGVSNLYLRSSHLLSSENYSRLITNTLLCEPERLSLADFTRSASATAKASFAADNVTVYKGTGPFGLFQTIRTDRKLSVFERRHGISQWVIPDKFASLSRSSSKASDFLFTIFRNTSVNTLETNLGVNSFFIRMAEPWVSYNRACYKVSTNSPFAPIFGGADARVSHAQMNEAFKSRDLAAASAEVQFAFRRCVRHPEFEILETQLAVRLSDSLSLLEYLRSQEAEQFKRSFVRPSIQTVTLRGQSASDSDAYFLTILKAMSGEKSRNAINLYRRSQKAYDSIEVEISKTPGSLLDTIVFADNAVSMYNKFIRRDTKMIIPNRVEDMRELCIDIIRNKFTERMGLITYGKLELDPERTKPYAYSKWYQDLIKLSKAREDALSQRVLGGKRLTTAKVGIKSARGLITNRDMFEISDPRSAEKTVLIKSKSRSTFVSMLKSWLAAKVKFQFDRDTVKNLLAGRLTQAHDYFETSGSFVRHAKNQYFTCRSRNNMGTHLIRVTRSKVNNKTYMKYDHILVFPENCDRSSVELDIKTDYSDEGWLLNLANTLRTLGNLKSDQQYKIESSKSTSKARYNTNFADRVTDTIMITTISSSSELRLYTNDDSISLFVGTDYAKFPVGYTISDSVDDMRNTITVTHDDFVAATKAYLELSKRSDKFTNYKTNLGKSAERFLDFCLTESSIETEDFVIARAVKSEQLPLLKSVSLDVLRTMLINNNEIGINFSNHRFSSTLLNMNKRRKSGFSHFTRKVSGKRVDYDSDDIADNSDSDEMVTLGKSDDKHVTDYAEDETPIYPAYATSLEGYFVTKDTDQSTIKGNKSVGFSVVNPRDWAEMDEPEDDTHYTLMDADIMTREEVDLFEASDADEEDESSVSTNQPIEAVTYSTPEVTSAEFATSAMVNSIFGDMMSGVNFDDIFDVENDSESGDENIPNIVTNELDNVFSKMMTAAYGKVIDEKDKKFKSEITGHTVGGITETARPIIVYLRGWLNTSGKLSKSEAGDNRYEEITKLSSIYLSLAEFGALEFANPLKQKTGSEKISLPVELSSLAIVSHSYT